MDSESDTPSTGGDPPASPGTPDPTTPPPADGAERDARTGAAPEGDAGAAPPTDVPDDDIDAEAAEAANSRDLRRARLGYRGAHVQGNTRIRAGGVAYGAGSYAAETIIKNFYSDAGRPIDPVDGPIPGDTLDRLRETYERPASHTLLVATLKSKGVAILCGAVGTGRGTTARLAAEEARQDLERGGVVVLDPDLDPRDLAATGRLEHGCAHVLEGDGARWAQRLRPQLLHRLGGQTLDRPLVIVLDKRLPLDRDGLAGYLVEHRPPEREAVLERHLCHRLTERPDAPAKLLAAEAVVDELGGLQRFTEIVALAEQLATDELDDVPPDELAEGLRARLRTRAQFLLGPPVKSAAGGESAGGGPDESISLWSKAFLLACVVLDGLSPTRVSQESQRLGALLHGVRSPSSPPEMPLFHESLNDWTAHEEVWFTDPTGGRVRKMPNDPGCRVVVRQRGLVPVVLEVLWHDHGGARAPLLEWLAELVVRDEERIRVPAAQAVGLLATFDFDFVESELLRHWAAADRRVDPLAVRRIKAAAWALERAATDDRLAGRIRRLLKGWSATHRYQDCALEAYGTTIGALFPVDALDGLERIARSRQRSVRGAVGELYVAGSTTQVLQRLALWSASPYPLLHIDAAMCLQLISRLPADRNVPALTQLLHEPNARADLLVLTRQIMHSAHDGVRRRGWDIVRQWVDRAGDDERLVAAVAEFVGDLCADPDRGLRTRLLFHLRLWDHQRVGNGAAADIDILVQERW
ncbi:hypothetical protein [Embleya sp. NPDC020886]|uniref:hypothetical protein n=1 Tax=Embleya sp. NPDC020886 TaxID=3363980 RepID=UPI00379279DD